MGGGLLTAVEVGNGDECLGEDTARVLLWLQVGLLHRLHLLFLRFALIFKIKENNKT